jgi:type I site-specific restriction endonuclease
MQTQLNLPSYNLKTNETHIWDKLRKKFVLNTPEEWVRQNFIEYLISDKKYPQGRMVSEYLVKYNGMNKRCDIALFDETLKAQVIIECKAPKINLSESTFYQIAKYASVLKAPLLILTNGLEHYCAKIDNQTGEIKYLRQIPSFQELQQLLSQ